MREYVAQARERGTKRPAFHRAQASHQALLVEGPHLVEQNKTILTLEIDRDAKGAGRLPVVIGATITVRK